jgi:arsenate reductase-like glutaredoxin family protein
MSSQPSIIKRPLIEDDNGKVLVLGFDEVDYAKLFLREK